MAWLSNTGLSKWFDWSSSTTSLSRSVMVLTLTVLSAAYYHRVLCFLSVAKLEFEWIVIDAQSFANGQSQPNIQTIAECQQLCIDTHTQCVGIEWKGGEHSDTKCFTFASVGTPVINPDITYYNLTTRPTPGGQVITFFRITSSLIFSEVLANGDFETLSKSLVCHTGAVIITRNYPNCQWRQVFSGPTE